MMNFCRLPPESEPPVFLMIALGAFYRVASVLFFLLFSYTELTDVTNYLNHYYLASMLSVLLALSPACRFRRSGVASASSEGEIRLP